MPLSEEEKARRAKSAYLQRTYAITLEEWESILAFQGGTCAICGEPPKTRALHTEHDHSTGLVRGLACFFCNAQILRQRVTPELLRRAADYLDDPPAVKVLGERFGPTGRITSKRRRKRKRRK
jgi:Recombination endonuclease VII